MARLLTYDEARTCLDPMGDYDPLKLQERFCEVNGLELESDDITELQMLDDEQPDEESLVAELANVIRELLVLVGRESDDPEVAPAYAALVKAECAARA